MRYGGSIKIWLIVLFMMPSAPAQIPSGQFQDHLTASGIVDPTLYFNSCPSSRAELKLSLDKSGKVTSVSKRKQSNVMARWSAASFIIVDEWVKKLPLKPFLRNGRPVSVQAFMHIKCEPQP